MDMLTWADRSAGRAASFFLPFPRPILANDVGLARRIVGLEPSCAFRNWISLPDNRLVFSLVIVAVIRVVSPVGEPSSHHRCSGCCRTPTVSGAIPITIARPVTLIQVKGRAAAMREASDRSRFGANAQVSAASSSLEEGVR